MLKSHMAACLVATALAAAPAFAQTSPAPSGGTDRPAATGSGSTTSGSSAMQPSTGATVGDESGCFRRHSGRRLFLDNEPVRRLRRQRFRLLGGRAVRAPSTSASGTAATSGSGSSGMASPSSAGSGSSATMSSASSGASSQVVSQQQPGQWMASKLIGTTVIGANNESIGDVNDVLLDTRAARPLR